MNRDALIPVALISIAIIVLTSAVVGTLVETTDIADEYISAIENAGLALVLVAVLVLLEWLSFSKYRAKGTVRPVVDGALVFTVAFIVTATIALGAGALGLDDVGFDLGPLVVDIANFGSGVVGLVAGAYTFYARNRDCYISPAERRAQRQTD